MNLFSPHPFVGLIRTALILTTFVLGTSQGINGQDLPITSYKFGDPHQNEGQSYELSGTVMDAGAGELIIGANIRTLDNSIGVVSDNLGRYSIDLPYGTSRIEVSFIGFATKTLDIEIYREAVLDLSLSTASVQLDQIIVSDQNEEANIERVISGIEIMDIQTLSQRTQFLGELDVLRSIQTLSGVTSVGDGASGFNVRGGNADENLILQDDALILNPTHTLGFFSLFHPDIISSVQLYKGNQPAYYGGRLSSVLQVDLREGNKEQFEVNGGVGMATSRLTVEGPIKKGSSSFIVGGRISYMDYLLNLVKNVNVKNSKSLFYDLTLKADARLSQKTKVGFSSFIAGDDFQFADEVNFDYETRTISAYVNYLINEKWNLKVIGNAGKYQSSLFDIQGSDLSRFSNSVDYLRSSVRNFISLNENMVVTAGADLDKYVISPGSSEPVGDESTAVPRRLEDEQSLSFTPFLQLEWNITPSIRFFGGLRYTNYNKLGPGQLASYDSNSPRDISTRDEITQYGSGDKISSFTGWEPRVSFNFILSDQTSLKAGYNGGFQYLHQISNTAAASPIDIWKLSDFYIEPQMANNFNLGIFRNFAENNFETSIEAFYRDQQSIVEYKDFPDLLLNEFLETEIVNGVGRAYGFEFNLKKTKGDTRIEINYTYSKSQRKVEETVTQASINDGNWYPSNYDKPHAINVLLSKKVGRINNLSVNFTYSTGRPITAPISNFTIDNVLNIPIFSERNQFRVPAYHRLDVAYTIGPFGRDLTKSENSVTISLYNLYNRRNAYSVFFRQKPFQKLKTLRLSTLGSIFPAITYNFKFK